MLSGNMIKKYREAGDIVIEPLVFMPRHLQPNSYDITLGNWVIRFAKRRPKEPVLLSPYSSYENYYEVEHCSDSVSLKPGERVLCNTNEFFGAARKAVPLLATRSTIARFGIDICGSAGFGDVGYINRWALEVQNNSPNALEIPVQSRIGQVFFQEIDDNFAKYDGTYNLEAGQYEFEDMLSRWKPEDMIPKGKSLVTLLELYW